ncbi:MarR family transcriptional regulator [Goodfellowiella coeruleoviolacea]|uniref:DNA-binding transcriptional regulator, MarR family n=1 Tax=Goodfellowiella coeruleoviolacea TaxID=334858 RepID=A0AAE3KF91_9PSEU|nr:MarR family transcriptional regulator [Goodfellowiella coeruleoviolacea]MCP2164179.1 DNA-binding transcriptional regulator, MarR family [Goodfellowiella coeruleoviolacea]
MSPRSPELSIAELTSVLENFTRMSIRLPSVQRLSFTTLSVLHTLSQRGPKRLTELTASEQVTQSAITQIVTKLERDGLVRREPDPSDGRAVLVHVTPAGAAIVDGRRAERIARLTELADQLTPAERAAIAAALPALARLVELSQQQH